MYQIYRFLIDLIVAFSLLNFYSRIQSKYIRKIGFYVIPIMYPIYRFLIKGLMIEPLQIFTSFLFIGIMLTIFEKKTSWIIFATAFLMTSILNLFAMLMAVITIAILRIESDFISIIVFLTWSISVLIAVILLDKYKKISLSTYTKHLESILVRKIGFIIGLLVILLYTFFMILPTTGIMNYDFTISLIIWGITTILVLLIIFLTHFLVSHMNDERKKQLLLEQDNERLNQEQLAIEEQLTELKQVEMSLQKHLGDVTSNYHNYKYAIPVLMNMQHKLIEEITKFSEYNHDARMNLVKNYTDQIRILSFEINDEFVADHIKSEIIGLNIPNDWLKLTSLLETLMQNAQNKGIYLSVYNYTTLWNDLNISDVVFIRLLSNLVDNAIKESCKLPESQRGEVQIIFKEEEGYFCFDVRDGANEFEVSILKNLGIRKNSTNKTGDGYAEIMLDLKQTQASFIIKEWQKNGLSE